MATRITPEEVENFISLYRAGKNTPEISQLTGRSLRAVCYSLRNAGIELRAEQPTQTSKDVEEKVYVLYLKGYLRIEIARELELWDTTVGGILRRRLGHEPDWDDPERKAKRAKIWGNPENQPTLTSAETEDRILALYSEGTGWNRIAAETGVSVKTVANVLARRGAVVARAFKLDGQGRLEIMTMLAAGTDLGTISQLTGLGEDAVKKFTGHWRPSLFRDIDTPEKAYWLGFLNADGTIVGVNPGNLALQCTLARKDRGHVVKLRDFLGIKRKIIDYEAVTIGNVLRPYSRLICQQRPVVMDLVRHGILPNKTGAEKPWSDGPEHLMPHYWRGMVDGDGSVPDKSFSVTLVGSYDVTRAFLCWAGEVCGTQGKPSRDKRSPDHWRAAVGGRQQVLALLRALYDDAPTALTRKKALADFAVYGKPFSIPLF